MRLAIIIKDKEKDIIAECLSSAQWIYLLDTQIDSVLLLEVPNKEEHMRGQWISQYLKDQRVHMVGGQDFGPKAISFLEEKGISVFRLKNNNEIEAQFKLMIKHIEK